MGFAALMIALVLMVVEITFSFDNAIINAKILAKMSKFWQNIFLTIGIFIAIFGMRVVFPIAIVAITAGLGWQEVLDLALNHPQEYSEELEQAHPQIAAFGGAFLLMLALHFFLDDRRETVWFAKLERKLQQHATYWMPAAVSVFIILILAVLPFNHYRVETLLAGTLGIVTYSAMHAMINFFERLKEKHDNKKGNTGKKVMEQTGLAAFTSFLYLEMLDASFSFDSVIGAFAVTNDIVLIALGLGVGAVWVRSITIFMVRNGTLNHYKFLEHGAHYTVFVLASVLLLGIFWHVPEAVAGLVGIGIIGSAILASKQSSKTSG
jgi:hypothetical protein